MSLLALRLGYGKYGIIDSDSSTRLLGNTMYDTEEWREDTPTSLVNSYSYKGLATAGSATSAGVWDIIRTSYDNNGNRSRTQFRSQIVWDNRTSGWAA